MSKKTYVCHDDWFKIFFFIIVVLLHIYPVWDCVLDSVKSLVGYKVTIMRHLVNVRPKLTSRALALRYLDFSLLIIYY